MLTPLAIDCMQNIGKRILLGGHGIMDGMKQEPTKQNTLKIIGLNDHGDVILRPYRSRREWILPESAQIQNYKII